MFPQRKHWPYTLANPFNHLKRNNIDLIQTILEMEVLVTILNSIHETSSTDTQSRQEKKTTDQYPS